MHGMCSQRHHDYRERPRQPNVPAPAQRAPDERVGDVDRERAAAVLAEAFRDGVLRVEEFDERLSAAYAATTVADLDAATRDLPGEWMDDKIRIFADERQ